MRPISYLNIILIFLLNCLPGCKPALMLTGHYKNPRQEDTLSIIAFANKENARYDALFIPESPITFKRFLDSITNKCPSVLIFNREAENIFTAQDCPWSNVRLLDSLDSLKPGTTGKNITVGKLLALLRPLDGTIRENGLQQYDYFIFYTWVKFLPKLSSKMIHDVNRFAEKKDHRVFIGSINLDMQRSWDTTFAASSSQALLLH